MSLLLHQYDAPWLIPSAGNMPNTEDRLFQYGAFPGRMSLIEHKAHKRVSGGSMWRARGAHTPSLILILTGHVLYFFLILAYVGYRKIILETLKMGVSGTTCWPMSHFPSEPEGNYYTLKLFLLWRDCILGKRAKSSLFGFILKL